MRLRGRCKIECSVLGSLSLASTTRSKLVEERVIAIGTVEAVITVRPGVHEINRAQLTQLVLDRVKSESTHARQLANIIRSQRAGEE